MIAGTKAFWVDVEYDREHASGGSRYAAYVNTRRGAFRDLVNVYDDADPGDLRSAFAAHAWRVATGPVMSPGYVRSRERVLGCSVARSSWDGGLAAEVDLMTGWPSALTSSREWRAGRLWSGWPEQFGHIYAPSTEADNLGRRSYLTCSASAVFRLDADALPEPDFDALESSAAAAIGALVEALNVVVNPIVQQLEQA